jgi:hypothetical protein
MPHRGVSCHFCDDVVLSFFKNLPQKGGFPLVIPYGSIRGDLHYTRSCAIPLPHEQRGPWSLFICQYCLQRRPAPAFKPGPTVGTWGAVRRRIIEGCVKTQPRDHTGARQCLDLVKQFEQCKTAVCHSQTISRPGNQRTMSCIICHARAVKG